MSEINTIFKEWAFHDVGFIYIQLAEKLERAILSGQLSPGERLPVIREMAELLHINPSTISKGYQLVRQNGLVVSFRNGQYAVTSDEQCISRKQKEAIKIQCCVYFSNMFALGFSKDEAADAIKQYAEQLHFTGGSGIESEA